MKRLLLPALIVLGALAGGTAGLMLGSRMYAPATTVAPRAAIALGDSVPDFALPDPAGRAHRLSAWQGEVRVLNYWASWCAPCIEEMPMFDAFAKDNAGAGIAVIGIAEDDPDAAVEFLRRHPVGYPILLGERGQDGNSAQLGNRRGVLPFTALVSADGRLLAQRAGVFDRAGLEAWLAEHLPAR